MTLAPNYLQLTGILKDGINPALEEMTLRISLGAKAKERLHARYPEDIVLKQLPIRRISCKAKERWWRGY